jgi:hypothetical protein
MGRIFRILLQKTSGWVATGELVGPQWDTWDVFGTSSAENERGLCVSRKLLA